MTHIHLKFLRNTRNMLNLRVSQLEYLKQYGTKINFEAVSIYQDQANVFNEFFLNNFRVGVIVGQKLILMVMIECLIQDSMN